MKGFLSSYVPRQDPNYTSNAMTQGMCPSTDFSDEYIVSFGRNEIHFVHVKVLPIPTPKASNASVTLSQLLLVSICMGMVFSQSPCIHRHGNVFLPSIGILRIQHLQKGPYLLSSNLPQSLSQITHLSAGFPFCAWLCFAKALRQPWHPESGWWV